MVEEQRWKPLPVCQQRNRLMPKLAKALVRLVTEEDGPTAVVMLALLMVVCVTSMQIRSRAVQTSWTYLSTKLAGP